jgi:drug/metabolite transporter superfamily protein YnfA
VTHRNIVSSLQYVVVVDGFVPECYIMIGSRAIYRLIGKVCTV